LRTSSEARTIEALLPETLPEDVTMNLVNSVKDDLGGKEFLLFRRESWCNSFDYEIGYPLTEEEEKPRWASWCRCGACGEEWHSGWARKGVIRILRGEDESLYPGIPDICDDQIEVEEGDRVDCPFCCARLTAVSTSSLKSGRTYRVLMGRMTNLNTYTAMVFWMLQRKVDREARSTYSALPWAAIAVGGDGEIYRFTHATPGVYGRRIDGNQWLESPHMGEPIRQRYYAWGCINNTCMGGFYQTDVPEQGGQTGEKTGLASYIEGGGEFPLSFLLRQKRWPGLEALAMAGWVYTIDSCLHQEITENTRQGYYLNEAFDLTARRPRDMLGMTQPEVEAMGKKRWKLEDALAWRTCRGMSAEVFMELKKRYGVYAVQTAAVEYGPDGLQKLDRYLQRQQKKYRTLDGKAFTMYRDYLKMHREAGGGETPIEIWPPDLRAAHDRAMQAVKEGKDEKLDQKFRDVRERWSGLEWSDGEICAILPKCKEELIKEGQTLHHCVGSYGEAHVSGKLIIFIRHARRPERSWFTLNIDVSEKTWREVQLHGYGNEHAKGKPLTIPRRVREFVDRWEAKVLSPAFRKVKREEARKEKKKKENAA